VIPCLSRRSCTLQPLGSHECDVQKGISHTAPGTHIAAQRKTSDTESKHRISLLLTIRAAHFFVPIFRNSVSVSYSTIAVQSKYTSGKWDPRFYIVFCVIRAEISSKTLSSFRMASYQSSSYSSGVPSTAESAGLSRNPFATGPFDSRNNLTFPWLE
jgi:hypothetical protein